MWCVRTATHTHTKILCILYLITFYKSTFHQESVQLINTVHKFMDAWMKISSDVFRETFLLCCVGQNISAKNLNTSISMMSSSLAWVLNKQRVAFEGCVLQNDSSDVAQSVMFKYWQNCYKSQQVGFLQHRQSLYFHLHCVQLSMTQKPNNHPRWAE